MIGFIGNSFFFKSHSQSIFSRNFLPWLSKTCDTLVLRQRLAPDLRLECSRWTRIKHIRFLAMNICEPHRKHRFPYCCIYSALHSNGSYPIVACVFIFAYCCRLYPAMVCLPRNCLCKNVFIEPLPSNGQMHHNIIKLIVCFTENTAPEIKKSKRLSFLRKLSLYPENKRNISISFWIKLPDRYYLGPTF
jgi:hypothetical protein